MSVFFDIQPLWAPSFYFGTPPYLSQ